jgi:alkanesulfonate monooxygenase SsuD/methylene tetrahydromethanopterin reductase-like flavin-dependent oxidoreductase (luciferase family)
LGYNDIHHWTELAKTLERGKFDALFIADVLGVYDVFGGDARAAFAQGVQVPVNDPFLLVPAMAAVTEHLCFGLTGTLSYEPPYTFARRVSTLDHLKAGKASRAPCQLSERRPLQLQPFDEAFCFKKEEPGSRTV